MTQVGSLIDRHRAITLGAADQYTPWMDVGESLSGIVVFCIQFNGSWNGTIRFDGAVKQKTAAGVVTFIDDPIAATNLLNGTTVASTTTGGTTTTELWRVDAAGLDGVRAYVSIYAAGSCTVIPSWVRG